MQVRFRLTPLRLLGGVVLLIAVTIIGALLVAWSGVYSIAASRGHPGWLNDFLELGMRRSVQTNSGLSPPDHLDLDDPSLIQLGAAHFRAGCAPCHAAPGEPINPVFEGMLPTPPRLEDYVGTWEDEDLHWIVYHGLQYAGMPAWSGADREDEVWAIVAFLRRLPELDREGFRALAGRTDLAPSSPETFVEEGRNAAGLTACARCHDDAERDIASSLTPRLSGQSSAYLKLALEEYRANRRQSGIMEPVAAELTNDQIEQLADYFAGLPPRPPLVGDASDAIELGRDIAENGIPDRGVGACTSCHGGMAEDTYPVLAGQSQTYLQNQLRLFRDGARAETPQAELMSAVAARLEDSEIDAVSSYFAATAPEGRNAPAADTRGQR